MKKMIIAMPSRYGKRSVAFPGNPRLRVGEDEAVEVEWNSYWARRLQRNEIEVVEQKAQRKTKKKAQTMPTVDYPNDKE